MAVLMAQLRAASPPLYWAALAHAIAIPILLVLLAVDSRTVLGINPWIKPLKFFVSVLIYLITVAWLLKEVPMGGLGSAIGWAVAISMVVENVLIVLQSARGVRSHFNADSPFDIAVFATMGMFILVNSAAMALFLVSALRAQPHLSSGYLTGIRLGVFLFLLGSAEAVFMLTRQSHTVGGPDGGSGLPFVNWSTKFGDLRIGHFIGLHALQALPLAGWLIDRWGIPHAPLAVVVAAVAYCAVFALLTLQALSGKPFLF